MTACANNKEGKVSGKKAVSATLAGVLAVGMVPAAALADEPAETNVDDEISLQAATDPSSVADGAIAAFEDGLEAGHVFTANDEAQGLVPTKVQPFGTTTADGQVAVKSYVVYKLCTATTGTDIETNPWEQGRTVDGETFHYSEKLPTGTLPTAPGDYGVFAVVEVNGNDVVVKSGVGFSIEAADVADAQLFEKNAADPDDLSDTEFVYDGTDLAWGEYGIKIGDTDITGLVKSGTAVTYDANGAVTNPTHAGKYTFVADLGGAYEGKRVSIQFEIKAFDLAAASVSVDDQQLPNMGAATVDATDITVNGEALSGSSIESYVVIASPAPVATGSYSVTLSASGTETADYVKGDIVNTATASYSVVNSIVTPTATYDGTDFGLKDLSVDFSADPSNAFDASKVKVSYVDRNTGKTVETDKYDLVVVDTKTNKVGGVEMLAEAGTYTVTAVLDAEGLGYEYAGESAAMDVTVSKGAIAVTDIAFAYEDEIVTSVTEDYIPGENILDEIAVTVKTANGIVDPSDYTVTVTKKVDGEDVETEAITDAGVYTVTVKAPGYNVTGAKDSITVTVNQRDLSTANVRVKDTFNYTDNGVEKRILPYTGEEIIPSYEWSVDGKTWYDLPAADYAAKYTQNGKEVELKEVGTYTATVSAESESVNYKNSATVWPEVSDIKVFADVPTTHWAAEFVYTAATNDYMKGYSGSAIFGPDKAITRADAVIVLYNMAGGNVYANGEENSVNDYQGFISDFTDVDKNAYYMAAVSWAQKVGITTGYTDGSGKFGPSDQITREQFATMLARYAQLTGADTSVEDAGAELAQYPDNGQIADWAKDAVAWLSEQEIMTGDKGAMAGYMLPGNDVTRAEVAKMAVSLQPEPVKEGTIIK